MAEKVTAGLAESSGKLQSYHKWYQSPVQVISVTCSLTAVSRDQDQLQTLHSTYEYEATFTFTLVGICSVNYIRCSNFYNLQRFSCMQRT